MNIKGISVVDQEAFTAWLASDEHSYDCAARDEGLACCLDKATIDGAPDLIALLAHWQYRVVVLTGNVQDSDRLLKSEVQMLRELGDEDAVRRENFCERYLLAEAEYNVIRVSLQIDYA